MKIEYIEDKFVDENLDEKLRLLLSGCFINGNDASVFQSRRYYNEVPQHRYLVWDGSTLAAQIAVHEKKVCINEDEISVCGIAEVCVASNYRGQGLVKLMLKSIHRDRKNAGDQFSLLFGDSEVYASSGYACAENVAILDEHNQWVKAESVMALGLNREWPKSDVKLIGRAF
jgi:predicted acetyltransferase